MWYYDSLGTSRGPVDDAEARRLVAGGQIGAGTRVWREGFADWVPAGQTELARVGGPPALPAVVPGHGVAGYGVAGGQPISLSYGVAFAVLGRPAHYAGFWIRVLAMLIDWVIVEASSFGMGWLVGQVARAMYPASFGSDEDGTAVWVVVGIASVIGLFWGIIYYTVLPAGRWQATVGKRIVGIHVVKVSGRKMGFGSFLGRYLAYMVSGFIWGIGFLMAGWTSEKRALHDMICETRVVYGRL